MMDDLISRQAAIDICENAIDLWRGQLGCGVIIAIKNRIVKLPSADRPTGRWIYDGVRGRFPVCRCSVCGNRENADWAILGDNVNYCPNCGCQMEVEHDSN